MKVILNRDKNSWLLKKSRFAMSRMPPFAIVNPFLNKPWFLRVCSISLLKTQWEKEKLFLTSNFSFSHSVYYPFGELTPQLWNCRLQTLSVWKSLKFVVWERVNQRAIIHVQPWTNDPILHNFPKGFQQSSKMILGLYTPTILSYSA